MMTAPYGTYADKWAGPWTGELTLRQREAVNDIDLRCQDAPGEPWYCFNCLADLPADPCGQDAHVCGDAAPEAPAVLPAPVEHKTRTSQPNGYQYGADGSRMSDKRGRLMHDRGSYWFCTCGEVGAGATREEARSSARRHREQTALPVAGAPIPAAS
jgi:hypothetical protein